MSQPGWGAPQGPFQGPLPPSPYRKPRGGCLIGATTAIVGFLLACGLGTALLVYAYRFVSTEFQEDLTEDYPGGSNNPITVNEGDDFTIKDSHYESGWQVDTSATGENDTPITGLSGSTDADFIGSVIFVFSHGETDIGWVRCEPTDASSTDPSPMQCASLDLNPSADVELSDYDTIKVRD